MLVSKSCADPIQDAQEALATANGQMTNVTIYYDCSVSLREELADRFEDLWIRYQAVQHLMTQQERDAVASAVQSFNASYTDAGHKLDGATNSAMASIGSAALFLEAAQFNYNQGNYSECIESAVSSYSKSVEAELHCDAAVDHINAGHGYLNVVEALVNAREDDL